MPLEKEQETFERELSRLLASAGKFVLIHGDDVTGIYDTYPDALKVGYERYGLTPFFVKQIAVVNRTNHFTRDIAACRT